MARATKFKAQWVDTCCQHKLWHLQLNLLLFVKRKCWQKSSEAQEASTFAWENTEVTCLSLGNAILASDPCAACSSQSRCQLLRGVERLMKCSCEGAAPFKLHPHAEQSRILAQTWHSISIEYHICTFYSDTSFLFPLLFHSRQPNHLLHIHSGLLNSFTFHFRNILQQFSLLLRATPRLLSSPPLPFSSLFPLSPSSQCSAVSKQQGGTPSMPFHHFSFSLSHLPLWCNDLNLSVSVSYRLRQ